MLVKGFSCLPGLTEDSQVCFDSVLLLADRFALVTIKSICLKPESPPRGVLISNAVFFIFLTN